MLKGRKTVSNMLFPSASRISGWLIAPNRLTFKEIPHLRHNKRNPSVWLGPCCSISIVKTFLLIPNFCCILDQNDSETLVFEHIVLKWWVVIWIKLCCTKLCSHHRHTPTQTDEPTWGSGETYQRMKTLSLDILIQLQDNGHLDE